MKRIGRDRSRWPLVAKVRYTASACAAAKVTKDGSDVAVNLTELPTLSVPYGFSSEKLPIGIQLVAKGRDEATILRLGAMLDRRGGLGDRRPAI